MILILLILIFIMLINPTLENFHDYECKRDWVKFYKNGYLIDHLPKFYCAKSNTGTYITSKKCSRKCDNSFLLEPSHLESPYKTYQKKYYKMK